MKRALFVLLGQSLVIENVTGASSTVGVGRAARSAPEGYTVSVGNWPTHVVNGATFSLQYDLLADFEPVALLSSNPYVVVARKDLPAKDLRALIAYLKANPDKVPHASFSVAERRPNQVRHPWRSGSFRNGLRQPPFLRAT